MKRINTATITACIKALAQSMPISVMVVIAKKIIPGYNLYSRCGFRESMAIPNNDAARQIVTDIIKVDHFMDFVLLLIEAGEKGIMGKTYQIPYMKEILSAVFELGYFYDKVNNIFVENPKYSITRNWGALKEGKEYDFAFLRIDIVANSLIVRENPSKDVTKAYNDLRSIIEKTSLKRNGRIWSYEGDSALVSFFFSNKHQSAVITGKEILHELFFYNLLECPLKNKLEIRVAVHSGPLEYSSNEEKLKWSETVRRVAEIESKYTKPGTMTISQPVKLMLDSMARFGIKSFTGVDQHEYFNYAIKLEKR
jgi:class 3 adenylate cyclase